MDKKEKQDSADASKALEQTIMQAQQPMKKLSTQKQQKPTKRKFEIAVYDVDETINEETGQVVSRKLKPVPSDPMHPIIIEVESKSEFDEIAKTYQMTGQCIKIVRDLTPSACAPEQPAQTSSPVMQAQTTNLIQMQASVEQPIARQVVQTATPQLAQVQPEPALLKKMKPKKFTVGDVQFKYDGEKMYQRQWIKLSPKEAANYRVIADSNNKIVSLNGKHIEALKWIAVDYSDDEDSIDASIDAIIDGD